MVMGFRKQKDLHVSCNNQKSLNSRALESLALYDPIICKAITTALLFEIDLMDSMLPVNSICSLE